MTLTLAQLHTSIALLNKMFDAKPDSLKTGYKLGHVIKSARDEAQTLNEAQLKLLQEHGKQIDGLEGQWEIDLDKREEFASAWNDLLTTEVELWGKKLEMDELEGLFQRLEFTVDEVTRLEWLYDVIE